MRHRKFLCIALLSSLGLQACIFASDLGNGDGPSTSANMSSGVDMSVTPQEDMAEPPVQDDLGQPEPPDMTMVIQDSGSPDDFGVPDMNPPVVDMEMVVDMPQSSSLISGVKLVESRDVGSEGNNNIFCAIAECENEQKILGGGGEWSADVTVMSSGIVRGGWRVCVRDANSNEMPEIRAVAVCADVDSSVSFDEVEDSKSDFVAGGTGSCLDLECANKLAPIAGSFQHDARFELRFNRPVPGMAEGDAAKWPVCGRNPVGAGPATLSASALCMSANVTRRVLSSNSSTLRIDMMCIASEPCPDGELAISGGGNKLHLVNMVSSLPLPDMKSWQVCADATLVPDLVENWSVSAVCVPADLAPSGSN